MEKTEKRFYVIIWIFIVLGLVLIGRPQIVSKVLPFIDDQIVLRIGEALFIAGVLGGTVDRYVKRKLATDVAKDVSPFMIGHWLPEEVQQELQSIQRSQFIRRDMRLKYKLSYTGEENRFVRVETFNIFDIQNLTDSPLTFQHSLAVDRSFYPDIAENAITKAGARMSEQMLYAYDNGGDSPVPTEPVEATHQIRFIKSIEVPSQTGQSGVTCWGETIQVATRNDADVFYFVVPTVGVTVDVEHPDNMKIHVSFGHRRRSVGVEALPPQSPKTWSLDAAFLPYQYVSVRWYQTHE